jgi:transglutaminase-like putative cysteine protease
MYTRSVRFGTTHRVTTGALPAFALLGLLASGRVDVLVTAACIAGLVIALAAGACVPRGWPRRAGVAALLLVLAAGVSRLAVDPTAGAPDWVVFGLAAVSLLRLATRVGAAHDAQIALLASVELLTGAFLGDGVGFGVCFLGVLVAAPSALLLSHLRREVETNYRHGARDRTGHPVDVPRILRSHRIVDRSLLGMTCLMAPLILLLGLVFFALAPRISGALPATALGRIDLGLTVPARRDPALVMRVRLLGRADPPPHVTLHLRGTAYDTYDGHAWSQSARSVAASRPAAPSSLAPTMRVELEPVDPPLLFVPLRATAHGAGFRGGPEGELRSVARARLSYDVGPEETRPLEPLEAADRARYLALPEDLAPRISALAASWTAGASSPIERARAIEDHLRSEYRYDVDAPSAREGDPVDHFLFVARRGHCQHHATATTLLLRAAGVPARTVTGFLGGSYNRFGQFYVVRRSDAHAWVEAYLDGIGWTTFDSTPPSEGPRRRGALGELVASIGQAWDHHVAWYDAAQRASVIGAVTPTPRRDALLLAATFLIVLAAVVVRSRRRAPASERGSREARRPEAEAALGLYARLDAAMAACGRSRALGTPPLRHAEAMAASGDVLGPEIVALTRVYLDVRFGGAAFGDAERRTFEARVRRLATAAHARRR